MFVCVIDFGENLILICMWSEYEKENDFHLNLMTFLISVYSLWMLDLLIICYKKYARYVPFLMELKNFDSVFFIFLLEVLQLFLLEESFLILNFIMYL